MLNLDTIQEDTLVKELLLGFQLQRFLVQTLAGAFYVWCLHVLFVSAWALAGLKRHLVPYSGKNRNISSVTNRYLTIQTRPESVNSRFTCCQNLPPSASALSTPPLCVLFYTWTGLHSECAIKGFFESLEF